MRACAVVWRCEVGGDQAECEKKGEKETEETRETAGVNGVRRGWKSVCIQVAREG